MKTISRRTFLKATGLASASFMVPNFLQALTKGRMWLPSSTAGKVLVIVQWSGGNDGLNTVIPYNNDIYYSSRPSLSIAKQNVITLNDDLGLNSNLKSVKNLFDQGLVSIVNNVGYPNPDRSHFRSMDIWQTASGSNEFLSTGWLGRYLDAECADCNNSYLAIELDDTLSLAMKGANHNGLAFQDANTFYKDAKDPVFKALAQSASTLNESENSAVSYLYKTLVNTESSAQYLMEHTKTYEAQAAYPSSPFAQSLKTIAQLIISGVDTRVYYVSLGSFDTHTAQMDRQSKLFQTFDEGIAAFAEDLQKQNRFKDVLIMNFSEFGRRVSQNASNGTDHGTANNMFFISGALAKPGIFNDVPDLNDLDEGDLKYHVDFRSIYATVLNKWLGADDKNVLGQSFDYVSFI